ncbi:type III restriction endonuclease subunit R [Leptospira levettii]|uniref:DEAD/DEAH box helicase family protein n=1 Tax=Leptospira levettii TaxID=2023178 RepID=UPI0010826540|nr:DEAD/DEAH box helicase family protein [Leptospira levettii]TGM36342.1 type III restriction endonuclease subunit R [Leptospira levettii]
MSNDVNQPIICSPFQEPKQYWHLEPNKEPIRKPGRRPSIIFPPETTQGMSWEPVPGVLEISNEFVRAYELKLVQKIRGEVKRWKEEGYPGATKITRQLLEHWNREDRAIKLFFAQKEAVETIIFLREARKDFLQGIQIPLDSDPPIDSQDPDYIPKAFIRYANKMATGTGKSTVMAMIIAWNLINKSVDKKNPNYVDTILVVVPNTTIKDRLEEIKPQSNESSIYRTRDLVPSDLFQNLNQGKVVITNWHVFEPQSMQKDGAKVVQSGVLRRTTQTIKIGNKNDTIRGQRILTLKSLEDQIRMGVLQPTGNRKIVKGKLVSIEVVESKRIESDLAVVNRILGRESSKRTPVLVLNDEAHHAYRIQKYSEENELEFEEDSAENQNEEDENSIQTESNSPDSIADEMDDDLIDVRESTVWMEGLDKIRKIRGIHFCVDLSATPYYIGRAGRETGKPFPWIVSDFSLMDAIESGLVKIPQLALRDSTGAAKPAYFRLWDYVMSQMTPSERGGKKSQPKPEAVLKYAHPALAMMMGEYENLRKQWVDSSDPRPPVFIVICKTKKIADTIFEWISQEKTTESIPPHGIHSLKNQNGEENTIRVYSDVMSDTDSSNKSNETIWMRLTLQTIGKREWSRDLQGREIYPEGFLEVANKLGKSIHPPGRDVRCIVSVSMLTEGWDCNTVTHIVGLRPFQSQLLCEQVVGRGLRRASYDVDESTGLFKEETSQILGVPFEVVPVKSTSSTPDPVEPPKRIFAIPTKSEFEITFPRVEKYTNRILSKIKIDWSTIPSLELDPTRIPAEVELKGLSFDTTGKPSYQGPGNTSRIGLSHFRESASLQSLSWSFATNLTRKIVEEGKNHISKDLTLLPHVAFPQVYSIIRIYIDKKVQAKAPNDKRDVFLQPYYSMMENNIYQFIQSENEEGQELPIYESHRPDGSTKTIDMPTKKPIYPVNKSHVNAVAADTGRFEQSAAFVLDGNSRVKSFVKNAGLGFSIPYWKSDTQHEYLPDFIVVLEKENGELINLILETKGFDYNQDVELKMAAAFRWVDAVNRDKRKGRWEYIIIKDISKINEEIEKICSLT